MDGNLCSISAEEFQRLQEQILELRTTNYTLIEENRKIANELKSLQALKDNERTSPLDVFTPKKLSDFKLRFLKSETSPSTATPKQELVTEEESIRKQNENLQQELRSLVDVNRFLQSQIDNLMESGLQPGQVSTKEFEMLSAERVDLMHAVEDLRKKIDSLLAEKAEGDSQLKSVLESHDRLQSELGKLQDELKTVIKEKEETISERDKSFSLYAGEKKSHDVTSKKLFNTQKEFEALKERVGVIPVLEAQVQEYQVLIEDYKQQLSASRTREEDLIADSNKLRFDLEEEYKDKLREVKAEMEIERKQKNAEIELITAQLNEMENTVKTLKQDLLDVAEDRKIDEKKGAAALRDLKRQLQIEKKRAEKLQERLKEVSPSDDSKEDSGSVEIDRYSVSSWSVMSGEGPRAASRPKSTKSSSSDIQEVAPIHHSSPILEPPEPSAEVTSDTAQLIARVAELQQERSVLEERVRHLEAHASTTAEELIRRGKLIERYCMEGGRTQSKVVSAPTPQNPMLEKFAEKMNGIFPKHSLVKIDEQKQQMLRLLEETLTKNMHLQDDIERLVQEVQKFKSLSKENL